MKIGRKRNFIRALRIPKDVNKDVWKESMDAVIDERLAEMRADLPGAEEVLVPLEAYSKALAGAFYAAEIYLDKLRKRLEHTASSPETGGSSENLGTRKRDVKKNQKEYCVAQSRARRSLEKLLASFRQALRKQKKAESPDFYTLMGAWEGNRLLYEVLIASGLGLYTFASLFIDYINNIENLLAIPFWISPLFFFYLLYRLMKKNAERAEAGGYILGLRSGYSEQIRFLFVMEGHVNHQEIFFTEVDELEQCLEGISSKAVHELSDEMENGVLETLKERYTTAKVHAEQFYTALHETAQQYRSEPAAEREEVKKKQLALVRNGVIALLFLFFGLAWIDGVEIPIHLYTNSWPIVYSIACFTEAVFIGLKKQEGRHYWELGCFLEFTLLLILSWVAIWLGLLLYILAVFFKMFLDN